MKSRKPSLDPASRRAFLKRGGGLAAALAIASGDPAPVAAASDASVRSTKQELLQEALRERREQLASRGMDDPLLLSDDGWLGLQGQPQEVLSLPDGVEQPAPGEDASPFDENPFLRMQRELREAMNKPVGQRRWVMVIDLRKCIGCDACTVGCKAENHLPPGVVYRPVIKEEIGAYPNVRMRFVPRPCMQCDRPPCVPVCPVGATYKRPDGIVEINYETCIGCRYCITACPYQARTFDFGDYYTAGLGMDGRDGPQPYETSPAPEYGRAWTRAEGASPVGNVRKCQFCIHRLEAGMLPACVTTCVGVATYFGDANDPESLVSELMVRPNAMRLKEEQGTEPKVYYLV